MLSGGSGTVGVLAGLVASFHTTPSGVAFTVVLVLHVAAALVAMVTLAAGAAAASRLLATSGGPPPASVRLYFSPGENWAGRALYAVPVLGFALLGLSGGAYSAGDGWVLAGLGAWVAATAIAEAVLWPAERRARHALAGIAEPGLGAAPTEAVRACRTVLWSTATVFAVLVAGMVVMFARP